MSLVVQEIPKVGLVMEAVKVVRWLKNVGDTISLGEPLVEVETEKSVIEIEATMSGTLVEQLLQVDQEATVGDRLALIESNEVTTTPAAAPTRAPTPTATPVPQKAAATAVLSDRVVISPVARKLAAEHGIDLASVQGSGPRGRIELEDIKQRLSGSPQPSTGNALGALSPMRRALARAMTLSNATVPQFTLERTLDWTSIQSLRDEWQRAHSTETNKPSVNDFLLQAVARTLIAYPALNATFSGAPDSPSACIVPAQGAHVGLVLALEGGLVVPVFHDLETLGLREIATRRAALITRGQSGVLKRDELDGATFSISNLGPQGPDRFSAIINPPQSAILAVGRLREAAVVVNGQIAVRSISDLTLTIDHRVVDGRLASEFLAHLVSLLEGRDWRA